MENFCEQELNNIDISSPKVSVYVSASAGTGKTKVLIDRILRLLLSGVEITKILCVTFTNAAAKEILERLELILCSWVIFKDNDLEKEIKILTSEPVNLSLVRNLYKKFLFSKDKLRFQTLHSFCASLLKVNNIIDSNDLGTIVDENQKKELLEEAFDSVINKMANREIDNQYLNKLTQNYDIETLFNLIYQALSKFSFDCTSMIIEKSYQTVGGVIDAKNNNRPLSKLATDSKMLGDLGAQNRNVSNIREDSSTKSTQQFATEVELRSRSNILHEYISSINIAQLSHFANIMISEGQHNAQTIINWLLSNNKIENFDLYTNFFLTNTLELRKRLPINKNFCDKYPEIKNYILQKQIKLKNLFETQHSQENAQNLAAFSMLAANVQQEYEVIKRLKKCIEYNDLITKTIAILQDPAIGMNLLYNINMLIEHVLIDEAQDLSAMQWHIIKLITDDFYSGLKHDSTIFVVGDVKQSIFGFQGAKPEIFHIMRNYWEQKFKDANKKWLNASLQVCFRSSPLIVNFVNDFCQIHKESISFAKPIIAQKKNIYGKIDKIQIIQDNSTITENSTTKSTSAEIELLNRFSDESSKECSAEGSVEGSVEKYAASFISTTVHNWLINSKTIDGKPVSPRDIMILFRKRCNLQRNLVNEFRKIGVPVLDYGNSRPHIVLYDLLSIAKFASLPYDDLNLFALLKSVLFLADEDDLFKLSYCRDNFIWNEIIQKSQDNSTFASKYYEILDKILDLYHSHDSIQDFYEEILDFNLNSINDNIEEMFGARGNRFVKLFREHLRKFNNRGDINEFVDWYSSKVTSSQDINEFDVNAIKVMTVHNAKGLESPIVIIADPESSENIPHDNIILTNDWFIINNLKETSIIKQIKAYNGSERQKESLRLLYVALTRAKNEIYLVENMNKCSKVNSAPNWLKQVRI